jgi:hypothetical protein
MKHGLAFTAILLSMSLAACGGDAGGGSAASTTTGATATKTTVNAGSAATRASGPPAPCSILKQRDVLRVLAARTLKRHVVTQYCVYEAGSYNLAVSAQTILPKNVKAERSQIAARGPGLRVITATGSIGQGRVIIPSGVAGAQSQMSLLEGDTLVDMVLTNNARSSRSTLAPVVRLGRAAAKRRLVSSPPARDGA